MKNIGIFGIGCIGSVLSKYLNQNIENQNFYFNRTKKNKIKVLYKNQLFSVPIQLTKQSKEFDVELDWLIICIKEHQYKNAIPQIKKLIGANTKIAVFRNGLNLASSLEDITDEKRILETIIDCSIQLNENGENIQFRKPKIIFPDTTLADDFMDLFSNSDVEFLKSNDFAKAQWEKLIESASLGSIQVLENETCSVFKNEIILSDYVKLIEEGIKVAVSEGVKLNINYKTEMLAKVKKYPDSKGSSMLSDSRSGKEIELNAKIGAILNIGLKNKIKISTTQRIYNSLLHL